MPETHDLAAVEALLEERDAVAAWLARIDEQGSTAPESVRDRVRRDYRDRLDGLTDRLRKHADTVASRLEADRTEHRELMRRAQESRDALAEAELRHGVGEYDDDRFESERARHVDALSEVEETLGEVSERIARLEEVHQVVSSPARPEAAAPVAPEPTVLPEEPEPWPEEAPEPEPEPAASSPDAEPTIEIEDLAPIAVDDDDETEGLLSIFDEESDSDDRPADRSDDRNAATPGFGPLSFTPSGGTPAERPERPAVPPAAPPIGMPGTEQPPRFVRPRTEPSGGGATSSGAPAERPSSIRVVQDPAPVLPEVPPDAGGELIARTLRCGECGAMNRPLEWYCEKCGAELSAV